MIQTIQIHRCRDCQSENIVKNGRNRYGKQQYLCKDCGSSKVLEPKQCYSLERKEEILRAYQERASLRGVARTFQVARQTITNWLKKTPEVAASSENARTCSKAGCFRSRRSLELCLPENQPSLAVDGALSPQSTDHRFYQRRS